MFISFSVLDLGLFLLRLWDPGHQQKLSPMQVLLSPRKFPQLIIFYLFIFLQF